jgi:hypothetical protein
MRLLKALFLLIFALSGAAHEPPSVCGDWRRDKSECVVMAQMTRVMGDYIYYQKKIGIPKSHSIMEDDTGQTSTNFPVGTEVVGTNVAAYAKDLDATKNFRWAKSTFKDTWDTHIVRGSIKYAGRTEWGILWDCESKQE